MTIMLKRLGSTTVQRDMPMLPFQKIPEVLLKDYEVPKVRGLLIGPSFASKRK